jgi:hypothetical protein
MNASLTKVVGAGVIFLFLFGFGYWLSRLGKPYQPVLFNVHKLIGLGAVIFLVVILVQRHKLVPLRLSEIVAMVVTALIFLATIVAGGLLSVEAAGGLAGIGQPVRLAISLVHKIFPYLAVLVTAVTLYLLLVRR